MKISDFLFLVSATVWGGAATSFVLYYFHVSSHPLYLTIFSLLLLVGAVVKRKKEIKKEKKQRIVRRFEQFVGQVRSM